MLKNILGVVVGVVVGMVVNMSIILLSIYLFPLEGGADVMDPSTLKPDSLGIMNLVGAWLAHGLGTLVGAFVAVKIGVSHYKILALIIGVFFIIGGIQAANQIPAPKVFVILDLVMAYIPMALLGYYLGRK